MKRPCACYLKVRALEKQLDSSGSIPQAHCPYGRTYPSPPSAFHNASHAALCTACHGVRSHAEPVALVGECSIPVV